MHRPTHTVVLAVVLIVCLAGCSATRLAYNRLDWIASWQVSNYLDFNDAQRELFDSLFAPLWGWHRTQQLPQYAVDLEGLAAAIDGDTLDRATLDDSVLTVNRHVRAVYERALPGATRLLASLDDDQLETLRARVGKDADKSAQRHRKLGEDGWRSEAADDMERALRRWIGRATPDQRARIDAWAQARTATPELWLAYRQAWTADFLDLLQRRRSPDFARELGDRLEGRDGYRSDALVSAAQADREQWMQLMMDLHAALEPQQRERFVRELRGLARDFSALASQP